MIDKTVILKKLKEFKGFSKDVEFAKYLGISSAVISAWYKRGTFDHNTIVEKFPEINNNWLLTGEGEMLKTSEPVVKINTIGCGTPIYDIDVSCGVDRLALTDENIEGYIDLPYIKKNSHIITARGDSMEPKVNNGDKIVLRKVSRDNVFFGQIYVVVTEDYRLLKYVHKHPNDNTKVVLRSANKHYDDMEISKIDIMEIMVVENILSIKTMM